jgi:hypothetical protein
MMSSTHALSAHTIYAPTQSVEVARPRLRRRERPYSTALFIVQYACVSNCVCDSGRLRTTRARRTLSFPPCAGAVLPCCSHAPLLKHHALPQELRAARCGPCARCGGNAQDVPMTREQAAEQLPSLCPSWTLVSEGPDAALKIERAFVAKNFVVCVCVCA